MLLISTEFSLKTSQLFVHSLEPPQEVAGEYCEGDDISYCKNDGICKYYSAIKERHCM